MSLSIAHTTKVTKSPAWLLFGTSIVLNGILWALAATFFPKDDPVTILHYSVGVGIDLIGEGSEIMLLPLVGLIIMIGNTVLGRIIAASSYRAAWIIWSSIPIVQAILLGAFLLLWRQNI